ncbi:hypothetical protein Tsubulata_013276 [Turnera subulata]|uniref:RRM domain-containing protein n=1 Tax=Turnera subulata TaxID=218843 RepID=A0A9Q0JB60_9ROSI|nr:hypothetical protein Tsubulata_013276 [Turnera subulata]
MNNNQVLSIYVENVPLRWLPTDLHMVKSKFGEVMDVFIPSKWNRASNTYAFVGFKNNGDTQTLLQNINSMQRIGVSITANVAKARLGDNRSSPGSSSRTRITRPSRLTTDCCALGVLKSLMPFKKLNDLFPTNESLVIDIMPLEGVSFLFKFSSPTERNAMISEKLIWFHHLFEVFKEWEDGDSGRDRLCLVLVKGVPPCAWSENFFRLIMSKVDSKVD